MRRPKLCPECGGPCLPEEVQGLCPSCLRRMLLRLESQAAVQEPKNADEKRSADVPRQSGNQDLRASTIVLSFLLCVIPTTRAQLVADGATNTLSNVTNNITGD